MTAKVLRSLCHGCRMLACVMDGFSGEIQESDLFEA